MIWITCFFKFLSWILLGCLVNVPQAPQINPGWLNHNSGINLSPSNTNLLTILLTLKETRNSYFCATRKNLWLMLVSWTFWKVLSQKKGNYMFSQLSWRKLLKVAVFVIFRTSMILLLEIHQSFKGLFLKELRVFFKLVISVIEYYPTLFWVGFLGVRFEVERGGEGGGIALLSKTC